MSDTRATGGTALPEDQRAGLDPVLRATGTAHGLANAWYTDPACFDREREHLFAKTWACIGFAPDLPRPGSAVPVELMGLPLLMVRDADGAIRVFHNVCRHRGMKLLREPARLKSRIVCPYHAWSYELSGALARTPHIGGVGRHKVAGFDPADCGLATVRSAVWFDLVFVNLSGDGPAFADWIAPLAERWSDFAAADLYPDPDGPGFGFDLRCNWKLAVENYCEAYHLPTLHPSLNRISRLQDHYDIVQEGGFAGQGSTAYRGAFGPDGDRFPSCTGLSEKWAEGAEYVALYPNVLLGNHRDHFYAVLLLPIAPDRTLEQAWIWYFDADATTPERAGARAALAETWREVFLEDVTAVEGMQAGRASPGFDGGRFSPAMDGATHAFHRWAAARLGGRPAAPELSQAGRTVDAPAVGD